MIEPREHSYRTPQERENLVARLMARLQEFTLDERNEIDASFDWGVDVGTGPDGLETTMERNRTVTILVLVNGGARGNVYPKPGSLIDRGTD